MRGAREAPAPRDSLNFRRASPLSINEFESGTFTIVLHPTSSFTYVFVIYGANFPFLINLEQADRINTKNYWKQKKRLCVRLRSGKKHHQCQICRSQSTNQEGVLQRVPLTIVALKLVISLQMSPVSVHAHGVERIITALTRSPL